SNTKIFMKIIMPLSRPMIAVVAMNGFIIPLADFVLASTILRTPESYTLPIGLYNLVNDVMGASYTTFAAGAILISIPIAVVFVLLQKNFVSGLTAGGIKG
ncbi:MAG TPA: ABC transporter permease subunit, partial [Candidatus Dormibacteraeota bacterium]|nr:ABC transporter permease subunit [Candidatus Dormibacteraeota bacterium]